MHTMIEPNILSSCQLWSSEKRVAPELFKDGVPFTKAVSAVIFDEQELQLAIFYCQNFFNVTGRAAIIPYVLSVVPTK